MTELQPHPRVVAALSAAGVPFVVRRHAECPFPIRSPEDFARCLGRPVDGITKTLFLEVTPELATAGFGLAVCPVTHRADLALLARRWNATRVELAPRRSLAARLDYPATAVSPLGAGPYPVVIDEAVFTYAAILIGAGVAGVELEMAPDDLQRACGATRLAFACR